MTSSDDNSNPVQELQNNEPKEAYVLFVFDINKFDHMSPLTKLDILDVVPAVATHFYYDNVKKAFLLVISQNNWNGLKDELKRKFMTVARRIKEETETGPLTTHQRLQYETSDLFEVVSNKEN